MHPPTSLLDTTGYEILERYERKNDFRFVAEFTPPLFACPECRSKDIKRNDTRSALFMDLPIRGKRVGVEIIRQRYICKQCRKTAMQPLLGIDDKRDATVFLVRYIEEQAYRRTFTEIANEVGVTVNTVKNIFHDQIKSYASRTSPETPEWLGIDEIHINNRHRCVITNVKERTLLDILESRAKPVISRRLTMLPDKDRVEVVTADMWKTYSDVAKGVFPQARIVIDKFHIVKIANEATETVRRSIGRDSLEKTRRKLMRDRYVFLKRCQSLRDFDKLSLEVWSNEFPLLGKAHVAKESFYEIYESKDSLEAANKYERWRADLPKELETPFKKILNAFTTRRDEVLAYFDVQPRVTNAYTESLNNLIRHINRNGRGYSFETLRAKLLFFRSIRKQKPVPFDRKKWDTTQTSTHVHEGALYKVADEYMDMGADVNELIDLFMWGEF